jgi:hypothetical protein
VLVADDDEDILTLVALRFRRPGLEVKERSLRVELPLVRELLAA